MTTSPTTTRVAIVDDHLMFAESVARLLGAEDDLDVVGVEGTVAGAVRLVSETTPDVVVIDYQLPDGDGVQAATAIRSAHPGIQVLMLTGVADPRVLVAAIEAGCCGFVTKDKALSELVVAVRLAQSGESYVEPRLLADLLPRFGRSYRGLGSDLTNREREVLGLLATGASNQAIADQLFVSLNTVRNHVQHVLDKLGAHSKLEAVAIASREGLISPHR